MEINYLHSDMLFTFDYICLYLFYGSTTRIIFFYYLMLVPFWCSKIFPVYKIKSLDILKNDSEYTKNWKNWLKIDRRKIIYFLNKKV